MDAKRRRAIVLAVGLASMLAVLHGGAARAGEGDLIEQGRCTDGTEWKLKLSPEDAHVEASFDLDNAAPGSAWFITLVQGDVTLFQGERVADQEGNIDVDVIAPAWASLAATAVGDGATCMAALTV